jgi:uncharacterized membrane protein
MPRLRPPAAPSLLLGVGLGGFVDGILLHQILQWHHLLTSHGCCASASVAGLEDNTLADGFFHALTWLVVVAGVSLAVRAWQRGEMAPPWRFHVGLLLVGWGAFNLVEGLIDHQLLGIHHVRDDLGGPIGWDIGFLVVSAVLVGAGWALARSGRHVDATRAGAFR